MGLGAAADPPSFLRNRRADEAERRLLMDPEGEGSRQRREGEIRALKMPALRRRLLALGEPTDGARYEGESWIQIDRFGCHGGKRGFKSSLLDKLVPSKREQA